MQRTLIAAAVATAAMLAASAAAQPRAQGTPAQSSGGGGTSVRNDSGTTLNCRIYRERRARYQTVVLGSGEVWRQEANRRQARAIFCDPPGADMRYRLRAGVAYHLVPERGSVRVVLRPL